MELQMGMKADSLFLSTLPARGATSGFTSTASAQEFLSTLPARGATNGTLHYDTGGFISIHAPREGSDLDIMGYSCPLCIFLSTLPARGATRKQMAQIIAQQISIHAPREGSD